jgi:hypothetical protein
MNVGTGQSDVEIWPAVQAVQCTADFNTATEAGARPPRKPKVRIPVYVLGADVLKCNAGGKQQFSH